MTGSVVGTLGVAVWAIIRIAAIYGTAVWAIIQFVVIYARDARNREFETFHRLVKELVEPGEKSGVTYIDRQCAVVFELRHFKRYHEFTERMLKGLTLIPEWTENPRLNDEIELTLPTLRGNAP